MIGDSKSIFFIINIVAQVEMTISGKLINQCMCPVASTAGRSRGILQERSMLANGQAMGTCLGGIAIF
jgi:hypothetical protein